MDHFALSMGQLYTATVVGGRVTVRDCMVASQVYLNALEAQFKSSRRLVAAVRAWRRSQDTRPGEMPDVQLDLAKLWLNAHLRADDRARVWLSEPHNQYFELRLAAEQDSLQAA